MSTRLFSTLLLAVALTALPACDVDDTATPVESPEPAPVLAGLTLVSPIEAESKSCEADPENAGAELATCDDLSFREQGVPWMYYTPNAIHLDEFVKLAQACPGLLGKELYATVSGYDPDIDDSGAYAKLQVLGLGFSVMAEPEDVACLIKAALQVPYSAIPYP